jgi:hypothetical protein
MGSEFAAAEELFATVSQGAIGQVMPILMTDLPHPRRCRFSFFSSQLYLASPYGMYKSPLRAKNFYYH